MRTRPGNASGFTLLEILVVIGLMALLAGLLLPGGQLRMPFQIDASSRVVAAELQAVQQRAMATGAPHRWVLDLDSQRFRTERLAAAEEPLTEGPEAMPTHEGLLDLSPPRPEIEWTPIEGRAGDWRLLDDSAVWFERVRVGDSELDDGTATIGFASDGGGDPAHLWLEDEGGNRAEVELVAFTGEVRILEGEEE